MIHKTVRFVLLFVFVALLASAGTVSQGYYSDTLVNRIEGFVLPQTGPDDLATMFEPPSFDGGWSGYLANSQHFIGTGPDLKGITFTVTVSTPVPAYVDLFLFNGSQLNEWARVSTDNLGSIGDWYTIGDGASTRSGEFVQSTYDDLLAKTNAAAVPEPATMGLMGASMVGLGLIKFRRAKR
jgi:hypothetical protein